MKSLGGCGLRREGIYIVVRCVDRFLFGGEG